jgi:hypothetical protein
MQALRLAIGGRGQNDSGAAGIGQPVMIVCGMNAGDVSVSAAHLKEALVIGSLATRLRETGVWMWEPRGPLPP